MTQVPPPPPQDPYSQGLPPLPDVPESGSSGLAIAALILGILSFVPCLGCLPAPVALILGIVALAKGTTAKGKAIAGIVTSVVGVIVGFFLMPLIASSLMLSIPGFAQLQETAMRDVCTSNLHQVGQGCSLYMADNKEAFPPSIQHLIDDRQPPDIFNCPSEADEESIDYFYFPATTDSPSNTIIACDLQGNHADYRNVLFADFSVGNFDEQGFQDALAEPQNAAFSAALIAAEPSYWSHRPD